jgi:hypothetical protein
MCHFIVLRRTVVRMIVGECLYVNATSCGCSKLIGTVLLIAQGYTANIPSPVRMKPNSNRNRSIPVVVVLFVVKYHFAAVCLVVKSPSATNLTAGKLSVPQHLGHQGLGSDGLLPLLFVSRLCA